MTVLMTVVGVIVFVISLFTVGFKSAWKRLVTLAITGLIIDACITAVAITAMLLAL